MANFPWAAFPDIEETLVELLTGVEGATCGEVTPADLASQLPFIRITRFGGADDRVVDRSRISIDAFAATRADSFTLAEAIRQTLLSFPISTESCVIDRVDVLTGPMEVPWASSVGAQPIRRRTASYEIAARRLHTTAV